MELNITKTLRELVIEAPSATRVFEKLGIDYCCGGGMSFQEACAAAGRSTDEVAGLLERARQTETQQDAVVDWQTQSLSRLISHIVATHHVFTRDELARLEALLTKVCTVHGPNHNELFRIQNLFQLLHRDLIPHMQKEEMVLFPYIEKMEEAASSGRPSPVPVFGTVSNPIRMMMMEHETAGELLKVIRHISGDFSVPKDGCSSYEALYKALHDLEQDLHQHIHLENNILFPRAAQMEGKHQLSRASC